jgi:hypothetical protein
MEQTLLDFFHTRIYVSVAVTITQRVKFDNKHTSHEMWQTSLLQSETFSRNTRRFKDLYPISSYSEMFLRNTRRYKSLYPISSRHSTLNVWGFQRQLWLQKVHHWHPRQARVKVLCFGRCPHVVQLWRGNVCGNRALWSLHTSTWR